MQKLTPVEEARALFTEGKEWPVLRWFAEKRRARQMADRATAALTAFENQVKAKWTVELRNAYSELSVPASVDDDPFAAAEYEFVRRNAQPIPEAIRALARLVKQADDDAYRARMEAEKTFAEAERRLSVALSRRGAEEAIKSYDLHYAAIDEAESARLACERRP